MSVAITYKMHMEVSKWRAEATVVSDHLPIRPAGAEGSRPYQRQTPPPRGTSRTSERKVPSRRGRAGDDDRPRVPPQLRREALHLLQSGVLRGDNFRLASPRIRFD